MFFSFCLSLSQQTEELQASSSNTVRKSSSGGSSFNSSIIRRGSLNSSNISGGRVSQAISDALSNAGTGTSSTSKGGTVSGGQVKRSGSIGTGDKGRAGSLVSVVEGISLISSEKKLEESPNGGVVVSSSSGGGPSLDECLGCSGTDGTILKWPLCLCLHVFCFLVGVVTNIFACCKGR